MLIESSLLLLGFAKVQPVFSTLVQAYFVLTLPIIFLLHGGRLRLRDYILIGGLSAVLFLSTAINQGEIVFALKNGVYLMLLPLLRGAIQPKWFQKRMTFIVVLTTIVLVWYIFDQSSYITKEFGGSARMVGFGVNPNVWGVTCVLLLASWRIWPIEGVFLRFFAAVVLLASIFLSGSSTALLCLPLCAAMSQRLTIFYVTLLIIAILTFFCINNTELVEKIPSLLARFELWASAFETIRSHTIFIGNGYDFFGAGISTVASKDVRIVDSFYISSFISGGVGAFLLVIWYFMMSPLRWAIKYRNKSLFCVVLIFIVSNLTGDFMENGFPANLIYWLIVLNIQSNSCEEEVGK